MSCVSPLLSFIAYTYENFYGIKSLIAKYLKTSFILKTIENPKSQYISSLDFRKHLGHIPHNTNLEILNLIQYFELMKSKDSYVLESSDDVLHRCLKKSRFQGYFNDTSLLLITPLEINQSMELVQTHVLCIV